ncbi:MAG: DUF1295 domain-containing protein [Saprospiraceae bacterium]
MKSAKILRLAFFLSLLLLPLALLFSPFQSVFLGGFGLVMAILTLLWVVSLVIKDASIIDIFWGIGFVIIAWGYAYQIGWEAIGTRQKVLLAMVALWGLRLAIYLAFRNLGKGEDYRYVEMRKEGGKNWWWLSFLRVFLLQGVILWIVSSIFVPALLTGDSLGILDYVGILLWGIGLFFEAVGDWQMMQFKGNTANKGKVMNKGLWKYSRHPNYFGDATLWWGFFCFCLAHPQGLFYIFSPLYMTFLLLKISGVAMLERTLVHTKPAYEEYVAKTSAFFPMKPGV